MSRDTQFTFFRVIRLCRITRIVRLCRLDMFRDLMVMINGALGGVRTLFWAFVLISVPMYGVAVVLRETLGTPAVPGAELPYPLDAFHSVPSAFFVVFRAVVSQDDADRLGRPLFLQVNENHGWVFGVGYCFVMLFMCFGLFNVIVAIFVDNVVSAAKFNDQVKMQHRLQDQRFFADKMAELTELIWLTCPTVAEACGPVNQFGRI